MAQGLAYLHHPDRRLVHRDLSTNNVLLATHTDERGFRVLLSDFGAQPAWPRACLPARPRARLPAHLPVATSCHPQFRPTALHTGPLHHRRRTCVVQG